MIFQALASGSNGNCSIFSTDKGGVLFDAGISRKRVIAGLKNLDIKPNHIKYVFITHAHGDHVRGLPVLMQYLKKARVVATEETIYEIAKLKRNDSRYQIVADKAISINLYDPVELSKDFTITTMPTVHDIDGSSGYHLQYVPKDYGVSYATDTAGICGDFRDKMFESQLIFLESNHEISLLEKSRRPYWLKMRIKNTHLSNDKFLNLAKSVNSGSKQILAIGHISGECNTVETIYNQLKDNSEKLSRWVICPRDDSSSIIRINKKTTKLEGGISSNNQNQIFNAKNLENYFS